MLSNIFKRKKIKEVFLLEKEFLIKIEIVEKKDIVYIKRTKILRNGFKIKEKIDDEYFDIFFKNKKRNKIFPIIKLSKENVEENRLNFAVKIGETLEELIYSKLKYNKINVMNKTGVAFYLENQKIKKQDINFELKIGKIKYLELENKNGLMVI